ncbi:MAG: zinc-binding alcohol dehydrogenase family protein [Bacteroidaceae bacterium]|nr:zinc-binding alcohol dehydrogenase family protein [Bacteroidaceae bacterium]
MKAIQISAANEMACVEIENPAPLKAGEVLVKINYVGFCGSDLNTYRGGNPLVKMPVIPGHEVSAEIAEVAEGVPANLKPGMKITLNPYSACGDCPSCRNRRYNACQHNETLGVQRDGAMREYIVMPWEKIIPAEGLDDQEIALVEPMSVGFHAVDRAAIRDIDTVLVIGCGMIGVGAIVRAALRGATVIATDLDDEKLELAKQMGATFVVNTGKEDLHERISAITEGRGVDVVIEAVGSPFTQNQAIEEVAFTGRVVFIGYAKAGTEFITKYFVQKELDIRGSRNAMPEDFRAVIRYMQSNDYPKEKLISAVTTPENAKEAMENWLAAPAKVFRILVNMGE